MPVGLPQVSSIPQQCRLLAAQIANAWHDFLVYLDLPSTSLYWNSCRTAYTDVQNATLSVGNLGYLTLKPLVLILWLLLQYLWRLLQFLSKHLFHHAYESAKKGALQLKWTSHKFWKWQSARSNAEIALELAVIAALIGCYVLRRYIEQRKYVQRVKSWYRRKKRVVKESYHRGVRRIADTSLFLAMLMPHVVFLASVASLKILMPRFVTYLAADTYLIAVLSFCYPMVWTIGLLQYYRSGSTAEAVNTARRTKKRTTNKDREDKTPKRRLSASFFPRTTPTRSVQKWLRAAATPVRHVVMKDNEEYDVHDDATYWLEYWVVYALLLAVFRLTFLMPVAGRLLGKYALLISSLRELQLVFFLWLFGVPLVTPELTKDTRPLPLLYRRAVPVVTAIYNTVSNAIPEQVWQIVVEKASSILDLAVMIKIISTETKDWLVHVLEESRPVLPPAITLFMPGFLTEYGVVYVKALVPCAKCCQAKTLDEIMSWLEYWVLHGLLSSVLFWWSSILWWIPFSTHAIFLLWCNMQIPKTTRKWYNTFEEELQAFGLLEKGDKDLQVEQTVTATMLRTLASSLPSAASADNVDGEPQGVDERNQTIGRTDGDDNVVVNAEEEQDDNSSIDAWEAADSDSSWASSDEYKSNNATARRSTRQRKQMAVY